MWIPNRNLLVQELRDRLAELNEYDYIMGDMAIGVCPWRVLDGHYAALRADPDANWLAEASLIVALAFQWGVRDGAHSATEEEQNLISRMADELRGFSARAEQIARVIDMIVDDQDEERVSAASKEIHRKYVESLLRN